ncbi:MAG: DUF3047 domain-containing protein [Deltaproteobacteria bacterium]|nr:MAG: DUF3047 domain-containing protein [Deltaproteobacteria bacterium]
MAYPFQRQKVFKIYKVQGEGQNLFLHAQDVPGLTNQVFKKFDWDSKNEAILSWKWRPQSLPKNGAENNSATNDSACAVYIAYGGWGGKALKYVWSTTLKPGTVIEVTPNKYYMVVVESGSQYLGQWKTEFVDMKKEYQKYFRGDFQTPKGFGLLTDGDQTQSLSACDYDDFVALPEGMDTIKK